MRKEAWAFLGMIGVTVLGCQALPSGPAADFVSAANALAQAESDYFDQIQAASDQSHLLLASAIYVQGGPSFATIAPALTRRDDFSRAKAVRMAVMAQLQNYTQQIAAITSAAGGTWIADDSKSVVTNVTTLLTDQKAAVVTAQQVGLIQSAVQIISTAIINNVTARKLQSLAQQVRVPIANIKRMVDGDNTTIVADNFGPGLVMDQQTAMLSVLNAVYNDRRSDTSQRLAAVTAWRNWTPVLVNKGAAISAALNKLIKANDALAANQPLSAQGLAQQAVADAMLALNIPAPSK